MKIYNDLTGQIEDDGTPNTVALGGYAAGVPGSPNQNGQQNGGPSGPKITPQNPSALPDPTPEPLAPGPSPGAPPSTPPSTPHAMPATPSAPAPTSPTATGYAAPSIPAVGMNASALGNATLPTTPTPTATLPPAPTGFDTAIGATPTPTNTLPASNTGNAGGALYYRDPSTNKVSAVSPEDYARLTQQGQQAGTVTTFKGTDAGSGQVYNPTFDRWYDPSTIPAGMTPEEFFGPQLNPGTGGPVAWAGSINDQVSGKTPLGAPAAPNPYGMDVSVGANGMATGLATPPSNTPTSQPGVSIPAVGGGDVSKPQPTDTGRMSPNDPVPPRPAVPDLGAASQAALTSFGPGNDLRSTQINPATSPALSQLDQLQTSAAQAVGGGKSRADIANDTLDAFDLRAQPQLREGIRAVGQRAATLGRLGAGQTAVEAMTPYTDYLTQRAALSKDLAAQTATGDITDRLNNLSALNSTQGQRYGQDASGRNELRTERDYQSTTARQAIQDAVQQFLLEQGAQAQDFNQGATLAGLGYGNSPSSLYYGAGQQYGSNAGLDFGALAQMLAPYINGSKS